MGTAHTVTVAGRTLRPTEVSALVLGHLLDIAERTIGRRPRRAIITVPAYFEDGARQATRDAGMLAGLEVERLINASPSSSATRASWRCSRAAATPTSAGTTSIRPCSSTCSSFGGGAREQLRADPRALARLADAAERAKIALSERAEMTLSEAYLTGSGANAVHLEASLAREDFEAVARPFVDKTLRSIDLALEDARMKPADLDRVILVGGASKSPLVARLVGEHLGRPAQVDADADRAVALGASRLAGRVAGAEIDEVLVDITPHTLVVGSMVEGNTPFEETEDLGAVPLIERDTVVPVKASKTFYTFIGDQPAVAVPIGQGEAERFGDNLFLGEVVVDDLPPRPAHSPIEVTFTLDISGVLEVHAEHSDSGRAQSTRITNSPSRLSTQERRCAQANVDALRAAPGEPDPEALEAPTRGLDPARQARADAMIARAERALGKADALAPEVEAALARLREATQEAAPDTDDRVGALADALLDLL